MRSLIWILGWAMISAGLMRAGNTVRISPPPPWVAVESPQQFPVTPPSDVSYGYDYLLLDNQVSVREQATYAHNIYRITAEGALQSASRVALNFDPAYEELTVHHLNVIRNGRTEDRLKDTPAKIIQQERDLDRHLLNGELTALFVLDDIRVGDIVDYAYTRAGWNPVLDHRYFSRITTEWAVPVRRQRFRLIAPPDRVPNSQAHGPRAYSPVRTQMGGGDVVLSWNGGGSPPIADERETPDWYEEYSSMQFSEFTTWAQVVRWAEPLYALPNPLPDSVREQAQKLTHGLTQEEDKVVALLQFVQQEIRYLGMELGAGSYRPTPPVTVLARRFGDCKDKTMLFCALARAAGLTAEPALLQTTYRDRIKTWLPTPHAFDHVIAVVTLANRERRWVDPTLTYQQGKLNARGLPDYGSALIIRPGNDRLSPVDIPAGGRSTVDYAERIDVTGFEQPAQYRIHTTFTGLMADSTRREFAQNTPAELSKNYVNYYASVYPGLTANAPPKMTDDAARNVVTVEESYSVPNLWKKPTDGGRWAAEFLPKPIIDLATRPAAPVRTTPLAIYHPIVASLTTTVNLPEDWTIKPSQLTLSNAGFVGFVGIQGTGRVVVMHYRWSSKADSVPANQVPAYVRDLNDFRDALGYTLTYGKPAPASTPALAAGDASASPSYRLNWMLVLVTLVTLTLALVLIRAIMLRYPFQPPSLEPPEISNLVGIRGWLYLVAIGVTVTPIKLAVSLVNLERPSFNQTVWEAITTPGNPSYQAPLGPLIVVETVCNLLLVVATVWQLFLFFRRHRLFPKVYIATLVFSIVLIAGDNWAAGNLVKSAASDAAKDTKDLTRVMIQAVIWIPYMLSSRRVRLTFTR